MYMEFLISQLQNKKGKYGVLPDEWYRFITKAEFDKAKQGYNVFISEYNMPQDRFKEIWSKETFANFSVLKSECGAKNKPSRTEKLFIPKV